MILESILLCQKEAFKVHIKAPLAVRKSLVWRRWYSNTTLAPTITLPQLHAACFAGVGWVTRDPSPTITNGDVLSSCYFRTVNGGMVHIPGLKHPAQEIPMGRKFCKFKTGFKKVKRADSARADSLGNLIFFSWPSMPILSKSWLGFSTYSQSLL